MTSFDNVGMRLNNLISCTFNFPSDFMKLREIKKIFLNLNIIGKMHVFFKEKYFIALNPVVTFYNFK